MSPISTIDASNLREPVLVALVVVLIGYLITRWIKQKGCPFATSTRGTTASAKQQMASTTGSIRLTLGQLADYDGRDASKPVYISVRGKIYDVTAGKTFYGPGGPYAVFAGKECARALAFMKVTSEDCNGNLDGATEAQLKTLEDWENKFRQKYGIAGEVVPA
eukprot:GHUV01002646.1.p1 GENE.GHUV01002646.1~~GHUV01002646.1.p1  ORF type:complete len:163 (+),score=13.94 GHUV01002646.1:152-640(+)